MSHHKSTLTREAVYQAAEMLMQRTGEATLTTVCQLLLQNNYVVDEEDVALGLHQLAFEKKWRIRTDHDATFRYSLGPDTVLHDYFYVEKKKTFFECALLDDVLLFSYGYVGQVGTHQLIHFASNQLAYLDLLGKLSRYEEVGYTPAEDVRPDWKIRLRYCTYLNATPLQATLHYRVPVLQHAVCPLSVDVSQTNLVDLLSLPHFSPAALPLTPDDRLLLQYCPTLQNSLLEEICITYTDVPAPLTLMRQSFGTQAKFLTHARLLLS